MTCSNVYEHTPLVAGLEGFYTVHWGDVGIVFFTYNVLLIASWSSYVGMPKSLKDLSALSWSKSAEAAAVFLSLVRGTLAWA